MSSPHSSIDDIRTEACRWVARLHSGRCTEEDRRALASWLAQGEDHRREFQEASGTWHEAETFRFGVAPEMMRARAYPIRRPYPWFPLAAAAIVLLVLTAGFWTAGQGPDAEPYVTAKGELREVTLDDGSSLVINTDSELAVEYSRSMRLIRLARGEVLATVAHGDSRPFEVVTRGGRIRDIGTSFSVRHGVDGTIVAVVDGVVVVMTDTADFPRRLEAGERLSFDHAGQATPIEKIDAQALTAWREGRLVFRGMTLDEVIAEFSRYHDARILLDDPGLKRLRVSGTFLVDDLDGLLAGMEAMLPVTVLREGNSIMLVNRRDR